MNEFRDDGTRVCPIHGLRFDPALSDGCIKCARTSQIPKPAGATSRSGSRPASSEIPPSFRGSSRSPSRPSYTPPAPMRGATPMVPFEAHDLSLEASSSGGRGALSYGQGINQTGGSSGQITLLAAPERPTSRRGLMLGLGLVAIAGTGAGAAAWILGPDAAVDWRKRILEFDYGPGEAHAGAIFVPSSAADEARPLLVLLDRVRHPVDVCLRYARHCEHHGWIAVSTNAIGDRVTVGDGAEVTALVAEAQARAKIDSGRAAIAGFSEAGDVACRLALLQPEVFGGAILECTALSAWRELGALAPSDASFFLFTREHDSNRDAIVTMKDEMEHKGLRVGWSEIAGGHEPMVRDELDPAFAFLQTLRA